MREHGRSPVDYARACECKEYQVSLRLTDKYAARFGMDENVSATNESGYNNMMGK